MNALLEVMNNMDDASKKKIKIFGIAGIGVIVLIIIIAIVVSIINRRTSYIDMESIMEKAAYQYYQNNLGQLPTAEVKTSVVSAQTLVEQEYMKEISKYTKDETCTGNVVVTYLGGDYDYQGYLTCSSFTTSLLVEKVKKDNPVVAAGAGLYDENGLLRFRGEHLNNYLKINDEIFRIIKIDSDNKIYITPEMLDDDYYSYWDDRYNSEKDNSSGINDYTISRIQDTLNIMYDKFDKSLKSNIDTYSFCYGKRSETENVNDGSIECSQVLENQKIGLMPLYEYIKASIAPACTSSKNRECKNYNYLVIDEKFWTATGLKENTFNVFGVKSNGEIEKDTAATKMLPRYVVALKSNVVLNAGKGTLEEPYTIR